MMIFLFIVFGFVAFGYTGYKIAIGIFELFFPEPKETTYTFVDKSVHNHYHEHKNLHIIDDETRKNILNNQNLN